MNSLWRAGFTTRLWRIRLVIGVWMVAALAGSAGCDTTAPITLAGAVTAADVVVRMPTLHTPAVDPNAGFAPHPSAQASTPALSTASILADSGYSRLVAVEVSQGTTVRAGQAIARFDEAGLRAGVRAATANVDVATAAVNLLDARRRTAAATEADLRSRRAKVADAIASMTRARDQLLARRVTMERQSAELRAQLAQLQRANSAAPTRALLALPADARPQPLPTSGPAAPGTQESEPVEDSAGGQPAVGDRTGGEGAVEEPTVPVIEEAGHPAPGSSVSPLPPTIPSLTTPADDLPLPNPTPAAKPNPAPTSSVPARPVDPARGPAADRPDPKALSTALARARAGLARLDAGRARLDAGISRLETGLEQARAGLIRLDQGIERIVQTQQQLRHARSAAAVQVDAAEVRRRQADDQLSLAVIRAPADGVVLTIAQVGDVLTAGATVATLEDPRPSPLITSWVSPADQARVCLGDRATVHADWMGPGQHVSATITRIGDEFQYPPTSQATRDVHLTRAIPVELTPEVGQTGAASEPALPAGSPVDIEVWPCRPSG